jgi:hypothetical protein
MKTEVMIAISERDEHERRIRGNPDIHGVSSKISVNIRLSKKEAQACASLAQNHPDTNA